ncbi:MAG TPA: hypothetical protein DIV86_05250 [Alphaproteobacteria bacterium]|mgnify:CR=1 FL=1|nr:hypothetical protein [Alphaproteobacteria bacterium]
MSSIKRLVDTLDRFFNYNDSEWKLPAESLIDMSQLQNTLGDCFLATIHDGAYRFSYLGENIIEALESSYYKADIEQLILPAEHEVIEKFNLAAISKKPLYSEGIFKNKNNIEIKYRMKIYPLTDIAGSDKVKYLFGGMRWKAEI